MRVSYAISYVCTVATIFASGNFERLRTGETFETCKLICRAVINAHFRTCRIIITTIFLPIFFLHSNNFTAARVINMSKQRTHIFYGREFFTRFRVFCNRTYFFQLCAQDSKNLKLCKLIHVAIITMNSPYFLE